MKRRNMLGLLGLLSVLGGALMGCTLGAAPLGQKQTICDFVRASVRDGSMTYDTAVQFYRDCSLTDHP